MLSRLNIVIILISIGLVAANVYVFLDYRRSKAQIVTVDIEEHVAVSVKREFPVELKPVEKEGEVPVVTTTVEIPAEKVLPPTFQLAVPFTSQAPEQNWDQPWQDACEEAAILMLDAYHKGYKLSPLFARDEILKMIAWQDEQELGYSIAMTDLARLATNYSGFRTKVIEQPTIDQIKTLISNNQPVLVVADGKALPNPYFSGDGPVYHALIITGYDEEGLITNDPGTKRGESFYYTYDALMNAIHDWNDGNVPQGQPVILTFEP